MSKVFSIIYVLSISLILEIGFKNNDGNNFSTLNLNLVNLIMR